MFRFYASLQECGLAALSGFAKGESHDSVAAGGSNGLRLALKAVKVELGSGAEGISESPHAFCILMNFIHQRTSTRNVDLTPKKMLQHVSIKVSLFRTPRTGIY